MSVTYANYLELDRLLDLQTPLSKGPEHDETLFIIIHQVYELWFKQILHEMQRLEECLEQNRTPKVLHALYRIRTILKTLVAQVDILETMSPLSFASFRTRLETASGFQSFQFRCVETILGKRNKKVFGSYPEDSEEYKELLRLWNSPTLYQRFLAYLRQNGVTLPDQPLQLNPDQGPAESEEVQTALVDVYRNQPLLTQVCEQMMDLDEGLQEWRYRHVKMVERTIGTKMGTGGSDGASYLRATLFRPLFPDLWAIRAQF